MAETPRDKLETEKDRVRSLVDDGAIDADCRDALLEWADALDDSTVRHKYFDEDGELKTLKPGTIEDYLRCMKITAKSGLVLLDTTSEAFNDCMDAMHDDEGKSKSRLTHYQSAAKSFYRYHDLGVDPEGIVMFKSDSSPKHDETDMFTEEEVRALRQAAGNTRFPVRNRAFLELLIYSGQRITALVTLTKGDVEPQEGYLYLNDGYDDEFGGLKGALDRGRKRPMFGASKYVRDYINYHRQAADDDDWLFIPDRTHGEASQTDHWAQRTAYQMLSTLANKAGVDKPVNPHNFRHYCATVLKRDYDLDADTIKMLFGHTERSTTLETTYQHLFDDDYIKKAEIAVGVKEEDDDSKAFTPDICPTCGEVLEDHWRRCPSCEEVFGPTEDFAEQLAEVTEHARDEGVQSLNPKVVAYAQAMTDAGADPDALVEAMADIDG